MNITKICTKCQEEKSLDSFRNYKRSKDGKVNWCKPCFKQHEKDHYKSNPERRKKTRERQTSYTAVNRQFVYDYLAQHPCEICAEPDIIVLEFDHLPEFKKKINVSDAISRYGPEMLKEEIAKCRVLCANCHRRHTAKQQSWWICLQ